MMIDVVVFDMDGVIIDSEPVWQEVREKFVHAHGSVWTQEDGDSCRGVSSQAWSTYISERLDGELTPQEVFLGIIEQMASVYDTAVPFFSGAVEAIERIASRYTIAVASGSPNELIDLVIANSGLQDLIGAVGYGDEVVHGKPEPEIYMGVLERLRVEPSSAVGVEDSLAGLRSVLAAGMYPIAIVSPDYQLPDELVERAVLQVPSLADLTVAMIDSVDGQPRSREQERP